MMLNTLKRLIIFLLPMALLAATFEFALFRTGDSWPIKWVTCWEKRQDQSLFGRRFFSDSAFEYKREKLYSIAPQIAIIGSSRVMQIRDIMFAPISEQVYNFGGMFRNVYELHAYAELITSGRVNAPETVIAGIDPWWLNADAPRINRHENLRFSNWFPDLSEHLSVGMSFLRGKQPFPWDAVRQGYGSGSPYYGLPSLGVMALQQGAGFRQDGSRQYSPEILFTFISNPVYIDREQPPVTERAQKKGFITPANPERLSVLIEALEMINNAGTHVVTFLPPFSSEVAIHLSTSEHTSKAWDLYTRELPRKLREHGIPCYEMLTPSALGMDDTSMYDGMHPSEVFMSRAIYRIVNDAPVDSFLNRVDKEALHRLAYDTASSPLAFRLPDANTGQQHGDTGD